MAAEPETVKPEAVKRAGVKDVIEVLEKFGLGLLAICYAVGLIVVNIHLNKYGVPGSISLFRLSYLTAGIWVLAPLIVSLFGLVIIGALPFILGLKQPDTAVTTVVLMGIIKFPEAGKEAEFDKKGRSGVLLMVSMLFIGSLAYIAATIRRSEVDITWAWLGIIASALVTSFVILISVYFVARGFHLRSPTTLTVTVATFILAASSFYLYALDFSEICYGAIPSYVGGGKPKRVVLLIDAEKATTRQNLEAAGLRFLKQGKGSTNQTESVDLLYVTEDEYIVLVKKGDEVDAVTLRRDLVQAVLYKGVGKKK